MHITNRFSAFAIHLSLSVLMFLALAAVIKFLWYPGVLFETEGGLEGIKLIAGVDIIIGPALTLMVYNVAKPQLRRDLTVIVLLQAFCLTAGMTIVAYTRPIAVVYAAGTYYTATKIRYKDAKIDINTVPLLQQSKPAWINLALPLDETEGSMQAEVLNFFGGSDIAVDRYEEYVNALKRLPYEGISLKDAIKKGYSIPEDIRKNPEIRAYQLETRYGAFIIAVNSQTGKPICVLNH